MRPSPQALQLLMDGSRVLAKMEAAGIQIDTDYLARVRREVSEKIQAHEARLKADPVWRLWQKRFGGRAKLTSDVQLGAVLFQDLGFEPSRWTDGGADGQSRPTVDAEALLELNHPFCTEYVAFKKLANARRTFLAGIARETQDGLLHPTYNLHTAVTYRSSCSDPNSQNWPKRNPEMEALVRPCIVARPGNYLVEVDFSGVEVRVGACHHHDPSMIQYITDPDTDMHRDTACDLFFLTPEQAGQMKRTARDWAKNRMVFPSFYGSVYYQTAAHVWKAVRKGEDTIPGLGISIREHLARRGITELDVVLKRDPESRQMRLERAPARGTFGAHVQEVERVLWKERFPVYDEWRYQQQALYARQGYLQTPTGFVLRFGNAGAMKRNDVANYSIQGSAFHCLLWTLIRVQRWLDKYRMRTLLVGQIHDSLLADVPPSELQDFLSKVKRVIEVELPAAWRWIIVPMTCEAEVADIGTSWFHKREWVQDGQGVWGPKPK